MTSILAPCCRARSGDVDGMIRKLKKKKAGERRAAAVTEARSTSRGPRSDIREGYPDLLQDSLSRAPNPGFHHSLACRVRFPAELSRASPISSLSCLPPSSSDALTTVYNIYNFCGMCSFTCPSEATNSRIYFFYIHSDGMRWRNTAANTRTRNEFGLVHTALLFGGLGATMWKR